VKGEPERKPPAELVAEAQKVPGGWVYEIEPGVDRSGRVPPAFIVGAWEVDESGVLTGEFLPNPNYRGRS
jgi:hypothetical protein